MKTPSVNDTRADQMAAQMIQLGTIEAVRFEDGDAEARVTIGDAMTGWLPMLANRAGPDAEFDPYEPGEQVAVFCPGGDMRQGLIMGAVYQSAFAARAAATGIHRRDYADGSSIVHDRADGSHRIEIAGDLTIVAGGTITMIAPRVDIN